MAHKDLNLESYAGLTDVDVIGPRTIDGRGYDDALKFSNCSNVFVSGMDITGGAEDCIDVNRGTGIYIGGCILRPTGLFAITIKGGHVGSTIKNVTIDGNGSEVDIDYGNWSDQCQEKTRGAFIDNVRRKDGKPVVVRVLWADMPIITNSNVKLLDRRWLAWLQRLGKRWRLLG